MRRDGVILDEIWQVNRARQTGEGGRGGMRKVLARLSRPYENFFLAFVPNYVNGMALLFF